METNLFKELHALWHVPLSGDMDAYKAVMLAYIDFHGYRFIEEAEEGSEIQQRIDGENGDAEAAFFNHFNSVSAYNSFSVFSEICSKYLVKRETARRYYSTSKQAA